LATKGLFSEGMDERSLLASLQREYPAVIPRAGRQLQLDQEEAAELSRAQSGDGAVWDEWFQAYYRPLFRYAYIRLRSRDDAEDIASQVFVEAYRGIGRYKHNGRPVLAWFYRIAQDLVVKRQKDRGRQQVATLPAEAAAFLDGPESTIANIDLLRALDSLTEDQREVIILRYFMAMPAHEAGDLIGKSQTAIFSLQERALARLRQRLREGQ
jgi:RNA polymerase sigma-70 factor (ECF subfamily)